MRLREDQILRLAEKIYRDLTAECVVTVREGQGAVVKGIAAAISDNFMGEQKLERDAEKLLDETISAMGRGAADIDRRKMLKMVKDKLARERKIVL